MTRQRVAAVIAVTTLAAAAGCGAHDRGARDDDRRGPIVARVGSETVTRAELHAFLADVERAYDARGEDFPPRGSAERTNVEAAAIDLLVKRSRERQLARRLGVEITAADVEGELDRLRARGVRFAEALAESGVTLDRVRENVAARLVQARTFEAVTSGATPSRDDVRRHYDAHRTTRYTRSEPRVVLYLFVKERELAYELRRRIAAGEPFEPLAKRYSAPRTDVGRTLIVRNESLAEVERVAFALAEGELSQPIRSPAGWHLVQAISPRPPERVLPLEAVENAVARELAERGAREAMKRWLAETQDELHPRYGRGYDPEELRVEFELAPGPQRSLSACRLPPGNYTLERLVELGCARDFLPPRGMALCPPRLLSDPVSSGILPTEEATGYATYATDTAGSCHDDPRGNVVTIGAPVGRSLLPYGSPPEPSRR